MPKLIAINLTMTFGNSDRYKLDDATAATGCGNEGITAHSSGRASVDGLINTFIPLTRQIARQIHDAMPASHIHEFDDLLQAGALGLLMAALSYRAERGVTFPIYARFRIRGEILDHLRRSDLAPRALRKRQRHLSETTHRLRMSLGREPASEETAEAMGITHAESLELARDLLNVHWLTAGHADVDDEETLASAAVKESRARPDKAVEQEQIKRILRDAMERLPDKERETLISYYFRGQSMREIGRRLGVHTTRVFQLRQRALELLGARLKAAGIRSAIELGHAYAEEN